MSLIGDLIKERDDLEDVCLRLQEECKKTSKDLMNVTVAANLIKSKLDKINIILDSGNRNVFKVIKQIKAITAK